MTKATAGLDVSVQHREIDAVHAELAVVVDELANASDAEFRSLFTVLIAHTADHFALEERLMQVHAFPHAGEHLTEHNQILNEMKLFGRRPLMMVRAYVGHRLAERFNLHITRMDSLFAHYLNSQVRPGT